jgi:hypothetical protein
MPWVSSGGAALRVAKGRDEPEIILNLWYVAADDGLIYSLRARAYVAFGSEDEKLQRLQATADIDYLIAKTFPVPDRFQLISEGHRMAVFPVNALPALDGPIALWEDAIRALEADLPAQTALSIGPDPFVCITPLRGDDEGNIQPHYAGGRPILSGSGGDKLPEI